MSFLHKKMRQDLAEYRYFIWLNGLNSRVDAIWKADQLKLTQFVCEKIVPSCHKD